MSSQGLCAQSKHVHRAHGLEDSLDNERCCVKALPGYGFALAYPSLSRALCLLAGWGAALPGKRVQLWLPPSCSPFAFAPAWQICPGKAVLLTLVKLNWVSKDLG